MEILRNAVIVIVDDNDARMNHAGTAEKEAPPPAGARGPHAPAAPAAPSPATCETGREATGRGNSPGHLILT
jgi:hypothetical protein